MSVIMREYYPAEIVIGGELDAAYLEDLCDALVADELGWDDEHDVEGPSDVLAHVEPGKALHLTSGYAWDGGFKATEAFCREHDLPYRCHADAYYEYDGVILGWAPGRCRRGTTATQDGEVTVPLGELRQALADGRDLEWVIEQYGWFALDSVPPFVVRPSDRAGERPDELRPAS